MMILVMVTGACAGVGSARPGADQHPGPGTMEAAPLESGDLDDDGVQTATMAA